MTSQSTERRYLNHRKRQDSYADVLGRGRWGETRFRKKNPKNARGEHLQWYRINGRFYVEESELLRWLEGCAVHGHLTA